MNEFDTKLLSEFGLGDSDIDLYFSLLKLGEGTIAECIQISKIRRTAAYSIMRKLISYGLVGEIPGKPVRFRALPPSIVLNDFIKKHSSDIREKHIEYLEELERLGKTETDYIENKLPKISKKFLKYAQSLYEQKDTVLDAKQDIIILHGIKAIYDMVKPLSVKKTVRIMSRLPILIPMNSLKNEKSGREQTFRSMELGIERRLLCETALLKDENFRETIRIHLEPGHPVRHLKSLPAKLQIFDDTAAIISIKANGTPQDSISMFLLNRELITMHITAFDTYWKKATPVKLEDIE